MESDGDIGTGEGECGTNRGLEAGEGLVGWFNGEKSIEGDPIGGE